MGNVVLLPSFHCPTVVEPVIRAGFQVSFYRIRKDLSVDEDDLSQRLSSRVAAVLVIHYCGFPAPLGAVLEQRDSYDYLVIEDWAHSFLTDLLGPAERPRGDVALYSFYKLVPCLVGGGLHLRNHAVSFEAACRSVGARDTAVIGKRLVEQVVDNSAPSWMRRLFHYGDEKRVALKARLASTRSEATRSIKDADSFDERLAVAGMPWISRAVLQACHLERLHEARRRNYGILLEQLKDTRQLMRMRTGLTEGVCPWGFPVLLDERSRFDHQLKSQGVPLFTFGERLHPLFQETAPALRADAEFLSRNMMLFSVHQNLDPETMRGIAERVNQFFQAA